MADKDYVKWLSDLKKRIRITQLKATVKENEEMLKFYWSLGEDICEKQKAFHGRTYTKSANGICSIPLRLNFCTKPVQNYKMWKMPQRLCPKYCSMYLGDIRLLS